MKIELRRTKQEVEYIHSDISDAPIYIGSNYNYFTTEAEAIQSFINWNELVRDSFQGDPPGLRQANSRIIE